MGEDAFQFYELDKQKNLNKELEAIPDRARLRIKRKRLEEMGVFNNDTSGK